MADPVDLEEFVLTLVGTSYKLLDTPEFWHWFGYPKKPARRNLLNRFVPADKLARERFLKRELILLCTERQLRWLRHHVDTSTATEIVARSLEVLTDGHSQSDRWWAILGFPSKSAARQYFVDGLATYLPHRTLQEFGNVFTKRMVPLVDERGLALWAVGVAHFSIEPVSPPLIMSTWLADCFKDARFTGAVNLRDSTFRADAQRLLTQLP